jgi:hypothetical protein
LPPGVASRADSLVTVAEGEFAEFEEFGFDLSRQPCERRAEAAEGVPIGSREVLLSWVAVG